MRIDAIETISRPPIADDDCWVIEQRASRLSAIATVVFVLPACLCLLAPFGMLAASAADQPALLDAVVARPMALAQLAAALVLSTTVLALVVQRLVRRLGGGATVRIGSETVTVVDRGLLGASSWSAPLASYRGIAHHIRTSLSGTRHELVLVHPEHEKCVLIEIAPRIGQGRIEEVCAQLRLPEVAARMLYEGERRRALPVVAPRIAMTSPSLAA